MMCNKQLSTGEELYVLDEFKFVCKEDYHNCNGKDTILLSGELLLLSMLLLLILLLVIIVVVIRILAVNYFRCNYKLILNSADLP